MATGGSEGRGNFNPAGRYNPATNVADLMAVMQGDGRGGHIEVAGILVLVSTEVSDREVAIKGLDRLIIM
jgi:hypothetical protein